MDILASIFSCIQPQDHGLDHTALLHSAQSSHEKSTDTNPAVPEKGYFQTHTLTYKDNETPRDDLKMNRLATQFVQHLLSTPTNNRHTINSLRNTLKLRFVPPSSRLTTSSFYTTLAAAILNALESAIRAGTELSTAAQQAFDQSQSVVEEVFGFVGDHPVFCTLVAIGILVVIAPWVLEVLEFAGEGIVEGSWAALWQSRYAGFVPKGSLFAFLQRCGMTGAH